MRECVGELVCAGEQTGGADATPGAARSSVAIGHHIQLWGGVCKVRRHGEISLRPQFEMLRADWRSQCSLRITGARVTLLAKARGNGKSVLDNSLRLYR